MKPRDLINITLRRLDKSIQSKTPIIVVTKEKPIHELIQTLEEGKIVTLLSKQNNTCTVKVSTTISEIKTASIITKAKKLKIWASQLPENNKGKLLLTTSKGLLLHHTAIKENIGGEVIGTKY